MSRSRSAAFASEPEAQAAADAHLAGGGGALGAVLAGYFAAAGSRPGVLLGPLTILIGGTGQGARAFDGRPRQPGRGAKRPRGFAPGSEIPAAARVAAPTAPYAAAIAHAYASSGGFAAIVRPAIEAAEREGATERAQVFERLARVGVASFAEPAIRRPLLAAASPSEGGALTPNDLEPSAEIDVPALEVEGETRTLVAPWHERAVVGAVAGVGAGLCAVDPHGVFAALCYRVADSGLEIPELGLLAPLSAVPVLRGLTRTAPGTALSATVASSLLLDAEHRLREARVEATANTFMRVERDPTSRWAQARRA